MSGDSERKAMPVVWALLGGRAGDNAQVLSVAEGIVAALRFHRLAYNGLYAVPNLLLGASLATLEPQSRAELRRPWPDLVIGAGRRSVPVMRWIRQRSGGRAKLVQLGRPRAPFHWFDLIIAPPQYRLPEAPNVLRTLLPPIKTASKPDEAERWAQVFAPLPRPWIGLLVGGSRVPYRFDGAAAARLASEASAEAMRLGGSLLVSTSPRTGEAEGRTLADGLTAPAHIALWSPGGVNAHRAILGLADRFIVTGESVSMMAEACLTGKPVQISALPRRRLLPSWDGTRGLGATLARSGLLSPPREPEAVQRLLVARGHAAMLGGPEPATYVAAPDERQRVIEAVTRLLVVDGGATEKAT